MYKLETIKIEELINNVLKMKKILLINFVIFFILSLLAEIILGSWFTKNNFGIHMRGHFNANFKVEADIHGNNKEFTFFRNSYAFRNYEIKPEDIDVVFNGGSTTIQSYLPYEETIVGTLNELFKDKNIMFVNAGLEGKSTYGYLCDFQYWFSRINDLNPKYYIFYTGYNDTWNTSNSKMMSCEGITSRNTKTQKSIDYLLNNSFVLSNIIKIKHKFFEQKISFKANPYDNNKFVSYKEIKKKYLETHDFDLKPIINYRNNLESLKKVLLVKKINPIFITQVTSSGNDNLLLYKINEETKKFAEKNDYIILKLDEEIELEASDFYDQIHTNKIGSEKVANYIYDKIKYLF
tara:strand:- start:57 stop:1106 length:1050 start_codon:yes stop_codon:yes gene_type:complete